MSATLKITRTDHTSATLRARASQCADGAQVRRMLAVALVLDGRRRGEAAALNGMDRQTLCDWVQRYNAAGIAGLKSRKSPGRPPCLSEQKAELRVLVVRGPDPAIARVVRWRCVDLQAEVAFKKIRWPGRGGASRHHVRRTPIEIWFQNEARVGQKGTHAYIWAPVGARPLMVRDNRHDSAYIFGAICPSRGVGAAMITPAANTEMMNLHLEEISTQVAPGACAVMLCDGAGWHQQGKDLRLPDNIRLLPLPPYSPELNPMENVWDYLRQNKLCSTVWDTYDQIVEACKTAWNWLIDDPERIRSIGTRDWACVSV